MPRNVRDGVVYRNPKDLLERSGVAGKCIADLKLPMPCLLDDMEDTAQKAYAGWPARIYIIDAEGKVAYRGAPGPAGFRPAEAETALAGMFAK